MCLGWCGTVVSFYVDFSVDFETESSLEEHQGREEKEKTGKRFEEKRIE